MNPRNKPRLYIGLHARPKHQKMYHWSLLISPKHEKFTQNETARHHAVKNLGIRQDGAGLEQKWSYESHTLMNLRDQGLLVRVLVGKVETSSEEVERLLSGVPVVQDDPSWRCQTWIACAYETLVRSDALGARPKLEEWSSVIEKCLEYLQSKKSQGAFETFQLSTPVPTMDLLTGREVDA